MLVTGLAGKQTAAETATFALNDAKNYIAELRETNPTKAKVLETSISLATSGVIGAAVGKGIEVGLKESGLDKNVGEQIAKITDPITEAAANGIDRYDLTGQEFHQAVVTEGQEGDAAKLKGGTGFFIGTVLGVGGAAWGIKGATDAGVVKSGETGASKNVDAVPTTNKPSVDPSDQLVGVRAKEFAGVEATNSGLFVARARIEANIAESAAARDASKFEIHSIIETIPSLDVATSPNKALVWSNARGGNLTIADNFISQNPGYMRLENTAGGQYLESLDLFKHYDYSDDIKPWEMLSARYANAASGEVTAFTKGASPTSVFNRVELPILLRKPDVTIKYIP